MIYLGNDEVDAEKQLGKIRMEFDSGSKNIFYQTNVDMSRPSIKYGDTISVTDKGPICDLEELDMQFNLFCGAYKGSIKVEFRPCNNQVLFDERRIRSVDGTGEISVVFGHLSNATIADLKIQLLNASAVANVHGVVAARNSKLDQPLCTNDLFWKSPANKIEVGLDGVIPLSKPRVGVPLDSKLYIDISVDVDGEQINRTVTFVPQTTGKKSEPVADSEKKTKILVKVTWVSKEDFVYSTYGFVYREWDDDESDTEEDTED